MTDTLELRRLAELALGPNGYERTRIRKSVAQAILALLDERDWLAAEAVHDFGAGYCRTCQPGRGHNLPDYAKKEPSNV